MPHRETLRVRSHAELGVWTATLELEHGPLVCEVWGTSEEQCLAVSRAICEAINTTGTAARIAELKREGREDTPAFEKLGRFFSPDA